MAEHGRGRAAHVALLDARAREVDAEAAVRLDVHEARRDDAALAVDDVVRQRVARGRAPVERLGADDDAVEAPDVAADERVAAHDAPVGEAHEAHDDDGDRSGAAARGHGS